MKDTDVPSLTMSFVYHWSRLSSFADSLYVYSSLVAFFKTRRGYFEKEDGRVIGGKIVMCCVVEEKAVLR